MGNEATCRITLGDQTAEAKALLETEELILRGALKARIPFAEAKNVSAEDGVLRLRWNDRDVAIPLGRDAAKWAEKIRNPKSLLDKLGVKAGQRVSVIGEVDGDFLDQLAARGCDVARNERRDADVIFFAVNRRENLTRLDALRRLLQPAGAVWVLRPKGDPAISEGDVMSAAKSAGLVDVKVVRFSATHAAEKLVIPVAKRP